MQHVMVLAGSGTSLGKVVNGPSMWTLWDYCVHSNSGAGSDDRFVSEAAAKIIAEIGYEEGENIELLLSRCEAFLQLKESKDVTSFVTAAKKTILEKCSEFLKDDDQSQLDAHRTFLHRLSRRRVRDSRLKVFTTNCDLCFETAASRQGLVVIDGFSFSQPRRFDPRFFLYDIIRRSSSGDDASTPLEGVFHLYKIHGSVNWQRTANGDVEVTPNPTPEAASLIYPARGKYQQSYVQPHLELVSQFLSALREPNTCLIVIGFGFNDDHLSEPIRAAVRTNPHLRLIIVNPSADDATAGRAEANKYLTEFFEMGRRGEDILLVNSYFADFANLIPDLKALTPAERLARDIKQVAKE